MSIQVANDAFAFTVNEITKHTFQSNLNGQREWNFNEIINVWNTIIHLHFLLRTHYVKSLPKIYVFLQSLHSARIVYQNVAMVGVDQAWSRCFNGLNYVCTIILDKYCLYTIQ